MKKRLLALFCAVTLLFTGTTGLTSIVSAASARTGLKATYYQTRGRRTGTNVLYDKVAQIYPAAEAGENHGAADGGALITEKNRLFDETIDELLSSTEYVGNPVSITTPSWDVLHDEAALGFSGDNSYITEVTGTMTIKEAGDYEFCGRFDNGFVLEFTDPDTGVTQRGFEFWGYGSWADADEGVREGKTIHLEAKTYNIKAYFLEYWGGELCRLFFFKDGGARTKFLDNTDYFAMNATAQARALVGFTGDYGRINAVIPTSGGGGQNVTFDASKKQYDATIGDIKNVVELVGTAYAPNIYGGFLDLAGELGCNGNDSILVEYEGYIIPKTTGSYTFGLGAVDNAFMLEINGTRVVEYWTKEAWYDDGSAGTIYDGTGAISLTAGVAYPVKAAFLETDGGQVLTVIANNGGTESNINDSFTFKYGDGNVEVATAYGLELNPLAVNAYNGTLAVGSALTVQYSDATLGGNNGSETLPNVRMHAAVVNKATGTRVECSETHTLNYSTVNDQSNDSDSDNGTKINASAMMGACAFTMPNVGSVDTSNLEVEVWTENGSVTSAVHKLPINDQFEGTSSNWSGVSGSDWLAYIDGSMPISQINTPGTHDSAAVYFTDSSTVRNNAKCQNVDIGTQLTYGVRYLDIRIHGNSDNLLTLDSSRQYLSTGTRDFPLVHAAYNAYRADQSTQYLMSMAIEECYNFLNAHPTEYIFFNVQVDDGQRDDTLTQDVIHEFIAKNPDKWYTKGFLPTLDEVRGKIIFSRRFEIGGAGTTDYNSGVRYFMKEQTSTDTSSVYISGSTISCDGGVNGLPKQFVYHIQDYYKIAGRSGLFSYTYPKWTVIKNNLENAKNYPAGEIVYNGFNSNNNGTANPITQSGYILGSNGFSGYTMNVGQRYGWMGLDAVTEAYARKIYQTNIKAKTAHSETYMDEKAADDGLLFHYDFEDVEDGLVKDVTGNGYDGKIVQSMATATVEDGAVTFYNNGKRGGDAAGLNLPSYVFRGTGDETTLSMWIRPDYNSAAHDTLFSISNRGGSGNVSAILYDYNGSQKLRFASNGKFGNSINADRGLSENEWQLVTLVLDGKTAKIYINGQEVLESDGTTWSSLDFLTGYGFYIARSMGWGDAAYCGSIGDVKAYKRALTNAEILDAYASLNTEGYTFGAAKTDAYGYVTTDYSALIATPYQTAGTTSLATVKSTTVYNNIGSSSATYRIPLNKNAEKAYIALTLGGNYSVTVNGGTPTTVSPFLGASGNADEIGKVVLDVTSSIASGAATVVVSGSSARFYSAQVCYNEDDFMGTGEYGFRTNSADEAAYVGADSGAAAADTVSDTGDGLNTAVANRRFTDGTSYFTWKLPVDLSAAKTVVAVYADGSGLQLQARYGSNAFETIEGVMPAQTKWQVLDVSKWLKQAQADASAVQGTAYIELKLADASTGDGNGGTMKEIKVKNYYGVTSDATNGTITITSDVTDDRIANEYTSTASVSNRATWTFSKDAADLTKGNTVVVGYTPSDEEIFLAKGETIYVDVNANANCSIIPGTFMGYRNDVAAYVPKRDGWRTDDLQSVRHTMVLDSTVSGLELRVTCKANSALTAADSIGLVGHSTNPTKNGLRSVYRIRKTTKADGDYITVGGVEKKVVSYGVLLATEAVVNSTGGTSAFNMDNESKQIKYYNFAEKFAGIRYDVADKFDDMSLSVINLTGDKAAANICTRGYVEVDNGDGTTSFAYTEVSTKCYNDYK